MYKHIEFDSIHTRRRSLRDLSNPSDQQYRLAVEGISNASGGVFTFAVRSEISYYP